MKTKTLTIDCVSCDLMKIDDDSNFTCSWGKGEPKKMDPHKGKRPIKCKLKR